MKNNPTRSQFSAMAQKNLEPTESEDLPEKEYLDALCFEIEKLKSLHKAGKLKWEPRGTTGACQK